MSRNKRTKPAFLETGADAIAADIYITPTRQFVGCLVVASLAGDVSAGELGF